MEQSKSARRAPTQKIEDGSDLYHCMIAHVSSFCE